MSFMEWLEETHPDVRLTPVQIDWIVASESSGAPAKWVGGTKWVRGMRSSRPFITFLWQEYSESVSA